MSLPVSVHWDDRASAIQWHEAGLHGDAWIAREMAFPIHRNPLRHLPREGDWLCASADMNRLGPATNGCKVQNVTS